MWIIRKSREVTFLAENHGTCTGLPCKLLHGFSDGTNERTVAGIPELEMIFPVRRAADLSCPSIGLKKSKNAPYVHTSVVFMKQLPAFRGGTGVNLILLMKETVCCVTMSNIKAISVMSEVV
jgi:hypothetical protein